MITELLEQTLEILERDGHYLQGRNISPFGNCSRLEGEDPAVCLVVAMSRTEIWKSSNYPASAVVAGGGYTVPRPLLGVDELLREAGADTEQLPDWSDNTPDKDFFPVIKKAIELARKVGA